MVVNKRGDIHDLSENCITALHDTGWLVLIDEAELFPYRTLEAMHRIYDRAGVGVVLAWYATSVTQPQGSPR